MRPIFVAATKQHVGKTSVSLSLMSGLKKRFRKVGFIKPVGQEHVTVTPQSTGIPLKIDKDVKLMKEHFNLDHCDYKYMSPCLIPRGYTKNFIDGIIDKNVQMKRIKDAYNITAEKSDIMVLEGTGHVGVGACVNASNAQVAKEVGADMVLIANGGIGSAFDELQLNYEMCKAHNVRIAGVVVNKVLPKKYEEVKKYMGALLKENWNVPLLGVVPDKTFLGCPALADLERLFGTEMLSGQKHRMRHYNVDQINLITTSLGRFLENLRNKPTRTLYITHATRNDILLAFLAEHQRSVVEGKETESALIVCGRNKYQIFPEIEDMILASDAPILYVNMSSWPAIQKIEGFTPKLNDEDVNRVNHAIEWYENHIDFDHLIDRLNMTDEQLAEPITNR